MPRKAFRVAAVTEPISFDLECASSGMQNFHCRDRLSAGTLMRFAEAFSSMGDEEDETAAARQGAEAIPAIKDFFNSVLLPENRERFWTAINDDDEGIPLPTIVEIAGWLSEVYSGERPTGKTSPDTSGETSSGAGSEGSPSHVDTPTYSRSEPTPSSIS